MKFEVLDGKHHDADGETYGKGSTVSSATDLTKLFPGKFKRVGLVPDSSEDAPKKPAPASKGAKDSGKASKDAKKPDAAKNARGTDVTKDFKLAEEEGFTVFQRDKFFHVYEGEETTPVNKTGLKKEDVGAFVKKHLEA